MKHIVKPKGDAMTDTPVSAEASAPDLVERLLAEGRHFRGDPDCVGPAVTLLVERAADTITALRAEVQGWKNVNKLLASQVEAQRREVERLTAALEEVRPLVLGANHPEARYPKAHAALKVRT
jgi:hypothetical protein